MSRLPLLTLLAALLAALAAFPAGAGGRILTDMAGRTVAVPDRVERLICSGPGCLRLLSYLGGQDRVVAVDSLEHRDTGNEARPYCLANPGFRDLPLFGEPRGLDNPELIVSLDPAPQVVLKVDFGGGADPDRLSAQTGLPVVVLHYGDLGPGRADLAAALRLMAEVIGAPERAELVLGRFAAWEADLAARTRDIPEDRRPRCYVGGVAMKGAHGLAATEPSYVPFRLGGARNVAAELNAGGRELTYADVAKEQVAAWDPQVVFLDLATTTLGESAGGLHDLRRDPAYAMLAAVRSGEVFGLLPYNSYAANFGSVFANAYFVGKALHPERFADVDPAAKADEIYAALLGRPVFGPIQQGFRGLVFARIPVR